MIFKIRKQDGSIGWSDYSFVDKSQQKKFVYELNGIFSNHKVRHKNKNEIVWKTKEKLEVTTIRS